MIQLTMIDAYCLILNIIDLSFFTVLKKREYRPKIELILCDIPFMWNLKTNDINKLTKQKQIHRLGEGMVAGSEGKDGQKG